MVLVVGALPWTYWMVFPVLALTVLSLLVFGVVYLKKVVEPRVLHLDQLQQANLDSSPPDTGGRCWGAIRFWGHIGEARGQRALEHKRA